jgi:hypothetical protein
MSFSSTHSFKSLSFSTSPKRSRIHWWSSSSLWSSSSHSFLIHVASSSSSLHDLFDRSVTHILSLIDEPLPLGSKGCPLLNEGSQLGHPLLGSGKLRGHLPAQPCLLDKAIPDVLLLT